MPIEFHSEGNFPESLLIGIEIAAARAILFSDVSERWYVELRYDQKLRVQIQPPTGPRFPALVYSINQCPSEEELANALDAPVFPIDQHVFFVSLEYMIFRQFTKYWVLDSNGPMRSDEEWSNLRRFLSATQPREGMPDSGDVKDFDRDPGRSFSLSPVERFFTPAHSGAESALIPLFFCTNRATNPNAQTLNDCYGIRRGNELSFGSCTISMPDLHHVGNIERPRWWRRENPVHHVVIDRLQELQQDSFLSQLGAEISSEDDHGARSLLIYVHGYNVSFARAVHQAAQLKFDLGFWGPVVAFSWASVGNRFGYPPDVANAGWSVRHFSKLLAVLQSTDFSRIHIIAHSLGNRVVTEALEKLSVSDAGAFKLSQVVLAAPDVDRDTFIGAADDIKKTTERITLYASDTDSALVWSERFHLHPRAGQGGERLVVHEAIDSIDATEVHEGRTGHSYVMQSSSVLGDLYQIIQNQHGPSNRYGLIKKRGGGWCFVTREQL